MNDPIAIQRRMENIYRLFVESSFPLQNKTLEKERHELLKSSGILSQPPLIEPVPIYESSGHSLEGATQQLPPEYANLATLAEPLFPGGRELYSHQFRALEASLAGRDVVITTGTGSGKTESFLLPVLAGLAREMTTWAPAAAPDDSRYWWRHQGERVPQWSHVTRQASIRTIVLYPLNALVEDQLRRLRSVLDRPQTRDWISKVSNGNLVTFGRYTGETPVAGRPDSHRTQRLRERLHEFDKMSGERERLAELGNGDEYNFQDLTGGEMWSRWDCHETPPDILITNYSMLNIMLMRDIEQSMFNDTRKWLEQSPQNVLHLVVDELHSYRGTAGTEVSYILRLLLNRLGLEPDSSQLRILATSASIPADDAGRKFLSEFFGRSPDKFDFIGAEPAGAQPVDISHHAEIFRTVSRSTPEAELEGGKSLIAPETLLQFHADLGVSLDRPLAELLIELQADKALLNSCSDGSGGVRATPAPEIAEKLFGNADDLEALRGLLLLLNEAKRNDGQALQPVRAHVFFQNIHNLWACSNPDCHDDPLGEKPGIGRLFSEHHLTCPECSSRVFELIVCEVCGEVFLGGRRSVQRHGAEVLSSDSQDLATVPDQPTSDKYASYAIVLPAGAHDSAALALDAYTWKGVRRRWEKAHLVSATGELASDPSVANEPGAVPVWSYRIQSSDSSQAPAFPPRCPCCETDYGRRTVLPTPLRRHGTGVQRSVQILSSALQREVSEKARKLVVFSDSRQDAARLSAGIEQDHYRDAVRVAALSVIREGATLLEGAVRSAYNSAKDPEFVRSQIYAANPRLANAACVESLPSDAKALAELRRYSNELVMSLRLLSFGEPLEEDLVDTLRNYPDRAPLAQIVDRVFDKLANLGICPAGTSRAALYYSEGKGSPQLHWSSAYEWSGGALKIAAGQAARSYDERARALLAAELIQVLFTHRVRTLEGLGLGYVSAPLRGASTAEQEAADAIVRSLAVRRRFVGSAFVEPGSRSHFTAALKKYLGNAGLDADRLNQMLNEQEILSAEESSAMLRLTHLVLVSADESATKYMCKKCNAVYLHPAAGWCVHCISGRVEAIGPKLVNTAVDYYNYLAGPGGQLFRMNAEELTGQSDGSDRISRQRRFQDVFLDGENELAHGVDLLSVTTTMEAGVDIGALSAVMMGNMPPRRFNYQQRVGRAGRRGAGLSLAVTLCRGRTHDSYYYANPKAITGDPPPPPFIDTASVSIFKRVLVKETLRRAFQGFMSLQPEGARSSESVHGSFGLAEAWVPDDSPWREHLERFLQDQSELDGLRTLTEELAQYTQLDAVAKEKAYEELTELPEIIARIAADPRFNQDEISERLANAGYLPMFGFPTRTRRLYLNGLRNNWPPSNVVDRNLEQAVSSFAPGASLVKDKLVYTVAGVVALTPQGHQLAVTEPGLYPPIDQDNPVPMGICSTCHALVESESLSGRVGEMNVPCPTCGEESVRVLDAREPRDFYAALEPEDYGGFFEFRGRTSRPMLGLAGVGTTSIVSNARVLSGSDNVLSFNDDDGRGGFPFMPLTYYPGAYQVMRKNGDAGAADPKTIALLARRTTDILQVGMNQWPAGHTAVPQMVEGRAAWYSLAFALRSGAARALDIESGELDCGLFVAARDGQAEGQAFLCDALENGAGYATYFNESEKFSGLLEALESSVIPEWVKHADICDGSCALCMRDYDNMPYHPILDWRLAADMIRLLGDSTTTLELKSGHWAPIVDKADSRIVRSMKQLDFNPLPDDTTLPVFTATRRGRRRAFIVRHPLWADTHPKIEETKRQLEEVGAPDYLGAVSPFTLLRMPTAVLAMGPT